MKTAVIYARYSSERQTEQSIEGQLTVCNEYAQRNDILIIDTYIDRAMTGTNDNRAAFQQMIKDSNNKVWDYVLVYKLDRFSRDKYSTAIHKRTLKNNGVKLISATENIPDSPEGIILESLLEGMAEYYSAELAQKINRGIKESWKKGNATGGLPPYGYKIKDKKYIIDEHEAKIVHEIFMLYSQNFCMREIKEKLLSKGYYRPNGQKFTERHITHILHNPRYTGSIEHHGEIYTNLFPRIVSDELWERVNTITESNKHIPNKKKDKQGYILSGKLLCGECKEHFIGVSSTSKTKDIHYYYICTSRHRKTKMCPTKRIKKKQIEDIVIKTTINILKNKETIDFISNEIVKVLKKDNKENITLNFLEQEKNNAIKASQNIISAIEQGIITEMTKSRLKELEDKISQLDIAIYKEKQRMSMETKPEDVKRFLQQKVFKSTEDVAIRKIIVNTFIKNIIVYNDKIVILFNYTNNLDVDDTTPENTLNIEKQIDSALNKKESANTILPSPPTQSYVATT